MVSMMICTLGRGVTEAGVGTGRDTEKEIPNLAKKAAIGVRGRGQGLDTTVSIGFMNLFDNSPWNPFIRSHSHRSRRKDRSSSRRRDRDRSRDRHRDRSRDRDRDRDRERSGGWKPRGKRASSNFDVKPEPGAVVPPGVGSGAVAASGLQMGDGSGQMGGVSCALIYFQHLPC